MNSMYDIDLGGMREQVAYLQGLSTGMDLHNKSNEGRLLVHTIDLLEELIDALESVINEQDEINEYVSMIDRDLEDLEYTSLTNEVDHDDYDDSEYYGEAYLSGSAYECPYCGEELFDTELARGIDDAELEEFNCPHCNGRLSNRVASTEILEDDDILGF